MFKIMVPLLAFAVCGAVALRGETSHAQISEEEFLRRMSAHKIGVEVLCGEIITTYGRSYPAINKAHLLERCRRHDSSKVVQDKKFIDQHRLSQNRSNAKALADVYGKSIKEAPQLPGLIASINRIDEAVAKEIDANFKVTAAQSRIADEIEHLADLLERDLRQKIFPRDGGSEFGRKLSPASTFIGENPGEIKMWSQTQRQRMIGIARSIESDTRVHQKLIQVANESHVATRLTSTLSSSHYHSKARSRAQCFERLLDL